MFTIASRRAATALEHARSRQILLTLAASERSLGDLAGSLGLSLSLLHYHVGRLRKLGLVKLVREDRRPGRPVKRYRAVARAFFLPAAKASRGSGDGLSRELREALERDRAKRQDSGTLYFVDENGAQRMRRVGASSSGDAFEAWIALSLDKRSAENLARDIGALFARYANHRGGRPHLAYCAFARRR